jgi:hypothetical protein
MVAGGQQEVGMVFIVDVALEQLCAEFRSRAADGQITAVERDLLIDGAVLLVSKIEELQNDARAELTPAGSHPARHATSVVSARPRRLARHAAA